MHHGKCSSKWKSILFCSVLLKVLIPDCSSYFQTTISNSLKCKTLSKQVESTLGKAEIARYEHFFSPQCFIKTCKKLGLFWERVYLKIWKTYSVHPNFFYQDKYHWKVRRKELCNVFATLINIGYVGHMLIREKLLNIVRKARVLCGNEEHKLKLQLLFKSADQD